jgi:hypothetical protein
MPTVGKLQMDMLVLALSCELTNVANMQWESAAGGGTFGFLGVSGGHHGISHQSSAGAYESLTKINTWYASQYAYLIDKMATTTDARGASLLDGAVMLWWSELGRGNNHTRAGIPFVMAGSGGGAFPTGRLLQYSGASHTDLLLSIAQAFGLSVTAIGDPGATTGPLAGLTG